MTRIRFAFVVACCLASSPLAAQDMEPKAYSASPVGANFFVAGYTWSSGAVVFDPTLPVSDVHADVQAFVVGIGHTFDVFGDLALVSLAMPYATADLTGKVGEQAAAVSRSGLADARMKFSINLLGNPAMAAKDFFRLPRRTVVGASVSVQAPTGQYYDTKLVNIGNNRWGFKPEVGVSVPIRKLDLDAYVGVWLFTANDDFYPAGLQRTQNAVTSVQAHVSYTFKPRWWLAVDSTWYSGGESQVADGDPSSGVNNSRLGLTLSLPAGGRNSIKVAYASGITVRTGTNFTTVAVGWQTLWMTRR
ncbi:MAG TPA: transporter [Vicinamibacterales bacterium]|nr:transporter [Vicinamibacterales bacterium]